MMLMFSLNTHPCPTQSTLPCREGSDEDFPFGADQLTGVPFPHAISNSRWTSLGAYLFLERNLDEERLENVGVSLRRVNYLSKRPSI